MKITKTQLKQMIKEEIADLEESELEPEEALDAADHAIEIVDALKDFISDAEPSEALEEAGGVASGEALASRGEEVPQWAQDMMTGLTELVMRTNRRLTKLDNRLADLEGPSE